MPTKTCPVENCEEDHEIVDEDAGEGTFCGNCGVHLVVARTPDGGLTLEEHPVDELSMERFDDPSE